ncbi:hypothetical protein QQS21_004246 [Conoideocrella luteorostrata]|uniref:Cytochrome P450 n=1 Tax=Conoideocrella luteorostrata TaxID=1105319 RepID=A0AAJ0FZZ9_9HYPO|nr:hypothetical protein QQS21_004246 [Conoideocrella luteorostrata]
MSGTNSIKWMLSQPNGVLGMWEAFNEMFQLSHSLGHEKYMLDTWAVDVSRRALTQELEDFIEPVQEELQLAVDSLLGMDTDNWKAVDLMDTMRMIINRTGGRFAVGLPLCRDEGYLTASITCIEKIVSNAGAVGLMPTFLRPFFGRLARWSTQGVLRKLESRCGVMLEERFAHVAANPNNKSQDPVDLIQRMIRLSANHRPDEMNIEAMTRRLIMANLGFIYQAGFAATNVLRNILESDREYDTINVLRAEAQRFAAAAEGDSSRLWTRANVARMIFADSVGRETLRLHTVPTRSLIRQVMVDGLRSDTGLPLPRGSLVSVVSQPMHTDPDRFPNPHAFEPFRFVDLRNTNNNEEKYQTSQADVSDKTADEAGGSWSPHAFISTANLLIFGRGRSSCPGRFLIDFQLKMLVHHLLLNYDIKLADTARGKRPTNSWLLEFVFPPKGIKMLVKRRNSNNITKTPSSI